MLVNSCYIYLYISYIKVFMLDYHALFIVNILFTRILSRKVYTYSLFISSSFLIFHTCLPAMNEGVIPTVRSLWTLWFEICELLC